MEGLNYYVPFLAALIPMAVGAIYYSPALAGNAWMKASGVTKEQAESGNMALIFGLAYFFSLMIAGFLIGFTIHQSNVISLFVGAEEVGIAAAESQAFVEGFMEKYGHLHRNFGHGAVHGGVAAVFFALPLISINSLFERRGWKYVGIHFGYWFITLILMGGVICQFV